MTTLLCWHMRWWWLILVKSPCTCLLGRFPRFHAQFTCRFLMKTTAFISHIQSRSHDDRFPIPLWETWLSKSWCSHTSLTRKSWQCPCRQFNFDHYGDHIQTCQRQSATLPAHEWSSKKKGFHYRRALFSSALQITLNIDGAPIASRSHTHPSHSETSRLLTSSLSLGVPVPPRVRPSHTTQSMRACRSLNFSF
jgi:hypothetical protein